MMAGGSQDLEYSLKTKPANLVNSLFMSTVNTAAKALVSVASSLKSDHYTEKWTPSDHLRFLTMLMTWLSFWLLRTLMDHFPNFIIPHTSFLLSGYANDMSSTYLPLPAPPSSSLTTATSAISSWDLLLRDDVERPTASALGRSLTHVLALMNEIPVTSRKYQFAMAMAEKIMEGNFRGGNLELQNINRLALSSAFDRTSTLLYRSIKTPGHGGEDWASKVIRALPFGSYLSSYVKGMKLCYKTVVQVVGGGAKLRGEGRQEEDIAAEKLAEELLWITNKLRAYGAVEEALVQWSFASGLASMSLWSNPRVQGLIVKISAMLVGDAVKEEVEVSSQVKFRLVMLWLPLFCHANNGLAYPVLTTFEKIEVERALNGVVSSLPPQEQEVVLATWFQDFAGTASEWPSLQLSFETWCQITRQLAM